jgi:hypothetical protein
MRCNGAQHKKLFHTGIVMDGEIGNDRLIPHPSNKHSGYDLAEIFLYGVYQIGDVYARSWTTVGTSSGSFIPKKIESLSVHLGRGISMTRQ